MRPPFGEYLVYKRGIHGNLSSQFLWTDNSWERLRAQSCGDGHEAADPLPRAFFLSKKARLTLGRGGMGGRKGSAIRIKTVVDLGAGTRTFFDLLSQMAAIAWASTGGQCRPGSKVILCLSNLLMQGDGIS